MAFDSNFIEELKMNINIVDVIGKEVALKKAGANYKGLCPFHSEKTPSFMVNEDKQIFNCFGCQEKGDVISFVEKYYKLSFMEAVEKLCNDYGIKMPERANHGPKIDYDKYYSINSKAARFFFDKLTKERNPGYAYLKRRGLSAETITKFGIGYAPDRGYDLYSFLKSEGVADDDMLKLGLISKGRNGFYDRFRGRVMFPIFNTAGKVIGFGGRTLSDDVKPKYLNSAESEIFLKKNNLYALNFTKKEVSDEDRIIVVEGYMDAISLYQGGIKNIAASLGTALTDNQAKLICRYSKNVVLSYDSDKAGIAAALRGIDVIRNAGGKAKILQIKDAKDPDEYIKRFGKAKFLELVDNAVYATDFKLSLLKAGHDLDDRLQLLEYIRSCVPVLRELGPVEMDLYIKKLADEFNISEQAISLEVRTDSKDKEIYRRSVNASRREQSNQKKTAGYDRLEFSLLILFMNNSRYLKRFEEDGLEFKSELCRKILSGEKSLCNDAENGTHRIELDDLCRVLEPEEENLLRRFNDIIKLGPDDEVFYKECVNAYKLKQYKDRRLEIQNRLSVAESMNDADEMKNCASELMNVDKCIRTITEGN